MATGLDLLKFISQLRTISCWRSLHWEVGLCLVEMRCENGPTASVAYGVLAAAAAIGTNRDTDIAQRNRDSFKGKLSPLRLLLNLV